MIRITESRVDDFRGRLNVVGNDEAVLRGAVRRSIQRTVQFDVRAKCGGVRRGHDVISFPENRDVQHRIVFDAGAGLAGLEIRLEVSADYDEVIAFLGAGEDFL